MKISKVRGPKVTQAISKEKKIDKNKDHFADQLRGAPSSEETTPAIDNLSVGAIDSVLTLQEVPDSLDKRSRAVYRDYGKDLLERLDQLRLGILAGVFSKDRLAELAHKLRERQKETDDPKLNEIVKEIELRAEVELAKLTRNS